MSTHTLGNERGWQWRRVAAWIGSVTTHGVVCALLLLPVAEPPLQPTQVEKPALAVELHEGARPLPAQPPAPVPPPRTRARAALPVPPTRTEAAAEVPSPADADTPALSNVVASAGTDPIPQATVSAASDAGAGGARTLAYAGALRTVYPTASVRAREQGSVLLRVLVDATGAVQEVRIQRSSGHARLDAAARDAVMRGRFRPVMRNGEAIPTWGLVPIEFRLDRA